MSKLLLTHKISISISIVIRARQVPTNNLLYFFLQGGHPFSSSVESLSRNSFAVDYLINSCGLIPKKAISASKYLNFQVADKPDSVLTFLKDHGFNRTQITKVVTDFPRVLACSPEKTLLPKLEFFRSKGFSDSDTAEIICKWPHILNRSVENQLIPSFNFFNYMFLSNKRKNITVFKRCVGVLLFDLENHGAGNIEILKKVGVPLVNIGSMLAKQPRVFMTNCDKFRKIVDEVTKRGFIPSKTNFMTAVYILRSMTKSTWNTKVEVYKKWGWSQDEIDGAFRYHPIVMSLSEDKINSVMDFWVNRMGWESSYLATKPTIIMLSLKNRILPRCEVYKALLSKGVKKPLGVSLSSLLMHNESRLLKWITNCPEGEAHELLKLYNEKKNLANI